MEEQPDVSIECPAEHTVEDAAGNVEENIAHVKANPSSALPAPAAVNDSSRIPLDAVMAGSAETTMDSESQPSVTVEASTERHLSEMTGDPESMTDDPGGVVGSEGSGAGNEVQHEDMDVSVSCKMETLNFAGSPESPEANGDCVTLPLTSGALLPQGALLSRNPGEKQSASGDSDDSSTSEDSSSDRYQSWMSQYADNHLGQCFSNRSLGKTAVLPIFAYIMCAQIWKPSNHLGCAISAKLPPGPFCTLGSLY